MTFNQKLIAEPKRQLWLQIEQPDASSQVGFKLAQSG